MDPLALGSIAVSTPDLLIMGGYLCVIVVAGVFLTRLASRDVDSYFLAGRRLPWWMLGLSGTASYFDVAGVMWSVAFFYIMGPRFLYLQWEWGFVMMAFFAAYMGKWLRRSRVLTGAEWMIIRFGSGPSGEFARLSYAALAVTTAVAFIGFAEYGCGRFLQMFIPGYSQHTLAIVLMTLTGIYTISGGLFGVILTDVIQFCLILLGSFVLIAKAVSMASYSAIAVEVPKEWFGYLPVWRWDHLTHWELTEGFALFALVALMWFAKGVFLSLGGPQQLYDMQRFLAARSPREASKAGMVWGIAMAPMFMVAAAVGVIGLVRWGGDLPHPENLYPVVIGSMLPVGIKGLVLAGLLSAFMSTFSSTVNAGAAYLLRDGYQNLLRPNASQRELVFAGRTCGAVIIAAGIAVGMQAKNIDTIFGWIMMTLGTAVLVPNVLRWFWWRFNGWGFAVGTLAGVAGSLVAAGWFGAVPLYYSFPVLLAISAASSVASSLLTEPTDMATLKEFYCRIRPAGAWGPVRDAVRAHDPDFVAESFAWDLLSGIVGAAGLHCWFIVCCYVCTCQWRRAAACLLGVLAAAIVLYFTWYRRLPAKDEDFEQALSTGEAGR